MSNPVSRDPRKQEAFLVNERIRGGTGGELADLDQGLATGSPELFKTMICDKATQTSTECGSKSGIAVSLIEGMIAMSRILFMMDLSPVEVQEALKDLKDTYELKMLLTLETESAHGRMHDQGWRECDK